MICIALLTLAAVGPIFRSSNPPRWATRGWFGELVTLAIVCMLALGLGYLGAGAIGAVQTGPDYLDLGLFVVVLCGSVMIWRRLGARTRPRAVEADGIARTRTPASGHSAGVIAAAGPVAVSASELPPPHKAA
jgi:hypothetical protein